MRFNPTALFPSAWFCGAAIALAALTQADAQSVFVQANTSANVGNGTANGGAITYVYTTGAPGGHPVFENTYPDTMNAYGGSVAPGLFTAHASTQTTQDYLGVRTASAFGAADLSTGTLHLYVATDPSTQAHVVASFNDLVTLHIPGAGPDTQTLIGIRAYAHGALAGDNGQFFDHVDIGGQDLQTGDLQFAAVTNPADMNTLQSTSGWVSPTFTAVSFGNFDFTGYVVALGADPVLDVTAYATLDMGGQGLGDYGHTDGLGFVLPPGVTLTSASGVFPSAIPDIPAWTAMLLGAGGIGAMLRKARRKDAGMPAAAG
jgi:hypothetical protein